MTSKRLKPYLRLIPLFRLLSDDELNAVAGRSVIRQLADGEMLDLRGSHANVLCLVIKGEVAFEAYGPRKCVAESALTAGQWAGEQLLTGQSQVTRTRLTAHAGSADVLLLWQRDVQMGSLLEGRAPLTRFWPTHWALLKHGLRATTRHLAAALRFLGSQAPSYPITTGVSLALALFVILMILSQPGRLLWADWRYLYFSPSLHWGARTPQQNQPAPEEQEAHLSRLLHSMPDHLPTQVALGNLRLQSGDSSAAMLHYAEAAYRSGAGANNLGVILLSQNDPAAALPALQMSAQTAPDVAVTHQNLGVAYWQIGQEQEAVRAFKEALRIDPTLVVARYHLGLHHLSQGELVEAGADFERALEQDAACAPAYVGLGLVYVEIENLQKAKQAFAKAVRLKPGSITAQFYLGWVQMEVGDRKEAQATLSRALALGPDPITKARINAMLNEEISNDK